MSEPRPSGSEPQTSGPSLAVFAALILASVTSTARVAARVVHTRRLAFVFLVYNLVLAWIPLGLSKVQGNRLLWLDLIALQAFAWTGLALGFVSLDIVQRVVARRVGRLASWLFAAAVMGLSAFGIYLGRFRRWNSWDVARDPLGLFADVAHMLLHPFAHAEVAAFSAVLGAFLLTAYLVVQSLTYHPSRNG